MLKALITLEERSTHNFLGDLEQDISTISVDAGRPEYLTSTKAKHLNRQNLEPALIFALTEIGPRIEVLACQKQAQPSH
jgi:hypothetical protein